MLLLPELEFLSPVLDMATLSVGERGGADAGRDLPVEGAALFHPPYNLGSLLAAPPAVDLPLATAEDGLFLANALDGLVIILASSR